MNTFFQKQLFMIVLIATATLSVIVGVWGLALFDSEMPPTDTSFSIESTTPSDTSATTETTSVSETTTSETTTETSITETTTIPGGFTEPTGKYIALTFDDGPSSNYTPEILDLLEQYQAKATFFVNGYNLSQSRASILQRAVALGCEIGNHTENHKNLTKLAAEEICEEITSTTRKIEWLCGTKVTLLRPPGGNTNLSVMQAMYDGGLRMHTIMWNNDSRDWAFDSDYRNGTLTQSEAIHATMEEIEKWPYEGAILLMHDIKGITPDVLELVLEKLSAEGFQFLTVSEMFDFEGMGEDAYFSKFYSAGNVVTLK